MFNTFIIWLEKLATLVPLPVFVILGSFIEELIAPIPSPLVMTTAGTIIKNNNGSFLLVIFIAVLGACSKTFSSLVLYFFSDKIEDFFVSRFGNFFKISNKDIEALGKLFNGSARDYITFFVLRSIPIIPSAPLSVFAGVIKLNLKLYLSTTFFGTVIKDLIYLYVGIMSVEYLEQFKSRHQALEILGYGVLFIFTIYLINKKYDIFNLFLRRLKK